MRIISKINSGFNAQKTELEKYPYLVTLKLDLLKIMVIIQSTFNAFVILYGYFTKLNHIAIFGQLFMLLSMGVFALLIKLKINVTTLSIIVATYYTLMIMPVIWVALGTNHPLPDIMSLYTVILIILVLDGRSRSIILSFYLVTATVIAIQDIRFLSEIQGLVPAINRSISLYLAFTLVAMSVWVFKSRFIQLSHDLYAHSVKDNLTGVYNSRMLSQSIMEFSAQYENLNMNFSVAMLDLDNFKQVNDIYGHDIGDEVLCRFVEHAKKYVRGNDILSRYGGDEFVFIFSDCHVNDATDIIRRVLVEMNELKGEFKEVNLSFSAGVCDYLEARRLKTDVLKLADKRMYSAKKNGKDSVSCNIVDFNL